MKAPTQWGELPDFEYMEIFNTPSMARQTSTFMAHGREAANRESKDWPGAGYYTPKDYLLPKVPSYTMGDSKQERFPEPMPNCLADCRLAKLTGHAS